MARKIRMLGALVLGFFLFGSMVWIADTFADASGDGGSTGGSGHYDTSGSGTTSTGTPPTTSGDPPSSGNPGSSGSTGGGGSSGNPPPPPPPQPNPQEVAKTEAASADAQAAEGAPAGTTPTVNAPLNSVPPYVSAGLTGSTTAENYHGTNAQEKKKNGASKSPDPVRYSTGELVTSDDDLSVSVDGLELKVGRTNTSGKSLWSSVGNWSLSLDTRVIWGIQPQVGLDPNDPDGLVFQSNAKQSALATNYQSALTAYNELIASLQAKVDDYANKYNTFTWNPAADSSGQALHDAYAAARDAYTGLVQRNKDYYPPLLDALYNNYLAAKADYDRALDMARLANINLTRDSLAWHSFDPIAWRDTGNDSVILVDEVGVPHPFQLTASPVYNSSATYADGLTNFYPSGSDATGIPGNGDSLSLTSDGRFLWQLKSGEVWTYNFRGQLTQRKDAHGNPLDYHYDGQGFLTSVTDKRNREILNHCCPV